MELLPRVPAGPERAAPALDPGQRRHPGAAHGAGHRDRGRSARSSVNHSGQLPSVTLSFDPAPGVSIGEAVAAVQAVASTALPARASRRASRHGPGVPGRAARPAHAAGARHPGDLHRARHPVRELHPPADDPLRAAVRGIRRAAGALDVRGSTSASTPSSGIIMLVGLVKKNAIMMIDFALEAERSEGKPPRARRSWRPAWSASGRS